MPPALVERLPPIVQEAQRKQPVDFFRRGLRLRQGHAGLDDHRIGERVDLAHPVEPLQ
jgi:hypothetical protein